MNQPFIGSEAEFEQIVNDHKLLLYSVVYSIAGNADADDIVQETFIHAYYHYGEIRDKAKLTSWLCAVARNKAYDTARKNARKARRVLSMDVLENAVTHTTPENLYIRREKRERLMEEIADLSDKYRETVMLYYFAGKSVGEISELLSVSEGTVKFRLSESRKKLRKELFDLMNEEKKIVEQKDIFAKVKEATRQARDAIKAHKTGQASEICDAVMEKIGDDLSGLTKEELEILYDFYIAKSDSIRYAEGLAAAMPYIQKSVEIAEGSGEDEWMSGAYIYYAVKLASIGKADEAVYYYKKALEKAEQIGKAYQIADCLYWIGFNECDNNAKDYGLSYFERVLEMKETLLHDRENECASKNAYALAYSAATAIKRAGERLVEPDGISSTAPVMLKSENGWILKGEEGFECGSPMRMDNIFFRITRMSPCLSNKLTEGYTFEQDSFSYSHTPIRSKFEVISMDEEITVPAGIFAHCLHTRYTDFVPDDENDRNKRTHGVTDIWYAEGVGVVCVRFTPILPEWAYHAMLKSYQVAPVTDAAFPDGYLPLSVGNQWSYEYFDGEDRPLSEKYDYESLFEVVCIRDCDGAAMIAQSAWSCSKKQ